MSVLTPEQERDTLEYEARRVALREQFKAMRYGAQQAASFDVREAPTTVSSVINGRIRSEKVLGKLEGWLQANGTK